jgi:hypothetical protein
MMRTCSEHIGDKEKKQKITSSTSPPKGKKNWANHEFMLSLFIGCMKLISKTICHHFWPEPMGRAQTTGKSHHIRHLSYSLAEVPPKFNFFFLEWTNLIDPSCKKEKENFGGSPK